MRGSIRKRGGSWGLTVHVGYDQATGKRHTITRTVRGTKREAEDQLAELLVEGRRLQARSGSRPRDIARLDGYLDDWLAGRRVTLSAHSLQTYERMIRLHIRPQLGKLKLRALTGRRLSTHYANLLKGGMSPNFVRSIHAVLSKALRAAEAEGLIPDAPTKFAEVPAAASQEVKVPSYEEIEAVLDAHRGHWVRSAILLVLGTGMRRGECIALRWDEVDLDAGTIEVKRNAQLIGRDVVVGPPKTRAGVRRIRIPEELVGTLRAWKLTQRKGRLRTGGRIGRDGDLVFPSKQGVLKKPTTFSHAFTAAGEAVGIYLSVHSLRHRHATDMLEDGLSPKVAMKRLGHSRIETTLQIYQHALEESEERAAEVAGSRLKGLVE